MMLVVMMQAPKDLSKMYGFYLHVYADPAAVIWQVEQLKKYFPGTCINQQPTSNNLKCSFTLLEPTPRPSRQLQPARRQHTIMRGQAKVC